MKANLPKPIVLSIGLIMKNEEKTLDKCLSSLQPLMQAIPSELIIADTGSEDSSKEIALRYTDQVYDFEWIDDFAAARNSTLDRAKGVWYMSIDADEWFENTDELIAFFKRKTYLNCYGAAYSVRNYFDYEGKEFHESVAIRLFVNDGTRYVGSIHESVPVRMPFYILHDYAHHYGYAVRPGETPSKPGRNLPLLLKQIETSQDLSHTYYQIAREYAVLNNYDKSLEYANKGKEALDGRCNGSMFYAIERELVHEYNTTQQYEKTIEEGIYYLEHRPVVSATDIDVRYCMCFAYDRLERYAEMCESYEEYVSLCEKFDKHELNETDRVSSMVNTFQPKFRTMLARLAVQSYAKEQQTDKALAMINSLATDEDALEDPEFYKVERAVVRSLKCYDHYVERYPALQDNDRAFELLVQNIRKLMETDEDAEKQFAEIFLSHPELTGNCADLFRLYAYRSEPGEEQLAQLDQILAYMLDTAPPRESYAALVYFALRRGMDFRRFIQRVDKDNLSGHFEKMALMPDLAVVITNYYLSAPESDNVFSVRWETSMLERIIVGASADEPIIMQLFERYCRSLGNYVANIYNPALLQSECIGVLPRAHQFGYEAWCANRFKQAGDFTEYLRHMEKAGERYPVMLPFVKKIVADWKASIAKEQAEQEERDMLMMQVKEKIRAMIYSGDMEQAAQALDGYIKVNPKDPDITDMRAMLVDTVMPS